MKVLGVTGTNGKTTVTYLLEAMIKKEGLSPGVIGTVNYRFAKTVIPADNTTPGPLKLQAILRRMADAGVDYAAMEVSSHALDQERVAGIPFHSAIFTNLTQDHLDYHLTMSRYFQAKAKLFKGLKGKAFAVLNYDDKYYRFLNSLLKVKSISYGLHPKAQVRAADIKYTVAGTQFTLIFPAGVVRIKTALIGRHNVYNILAAFSWGIKEGMSIKKMKSAIEDFKAVPGRLERIASRAGFSVFVDYAHTDDALKNALFSLRELSPRRIITVFGCGGERDRLKRPKMGRVVTQLSDFALITNDNPRCEDPAKIAKEIVSGIEKNNFRVCLDRGMAIRAALSMAGRGDIVLIAGKGHEAYQVLKKKAVHFDDREEARLCLKSLNY
jgi:UDP-N-acetylmuramyl-tripeptide synthetase